MADERLRLFLAFDVPGHPDRHMTVVFLGSRPAAEAPAIAAVAGDRLAPAGPLEPRRFLELPRRRPRVLAVEYADPTGRCGAIRQAVVAALADAGLHEPERRRWLPHVSVARLRDAAPPGRRGAIPASGPEFRAITAASPPSPLSSSPLPRLEDLAFTPQRLVLYRSHLGRGPARYEALESWELPAG